MEKSKHWWEGFPWRMIQTNLREIDMADIDAESYAQSLADFGATVVTLNAAGIIASYDSKLDFHTKSAYLQGSSLSEIIAACHRRGIRVIARTDFSKIRYALYEQHPEWAYRDRNGNIVNYNGDVQTCPNAGYQGDRMFEILREVLSGFPFDGVFCNMAGFLVVDYSGVYHGPCHCEGCREKFRAFCGMPVPDRDDPGDPNYREYVRFKAACTAAHRERLVRTVRAVDPEIAINNTDYIRTESNTEIGIPTFLYSASSNARLTAGVMRKRPADNASVDFLGFRYRDTSVSPALMALRQWQNLANAGSVSLYIMGRLDNHRDVSGFAPTRVVFDFHRAHEALFTAMRSDAGVLLIHRPLMARIDTEIAGWIRALTACHVPFDEVKLGELTAEVLGSHDCVILPEAENLREEQAALLDEYVRTGGRLICTGSTGLKTDESTLQCMGIRRVIRREKALMSSVFLAEEKDAGVFPDCMKAPYIAFGDTLTVCEYAPEARRWFRLIPEHPFGPPERCYYTAVEDMPGVIAMPWGSGLAIHIPWRIGSFYHNEGWQNTLNVMRDVLLHVAGLPDLAPGLTEMVELVACRSGDQRVIQLINESGCFGNNYVQPLPVREIRLRLPGLNGEEQVTALRGGKVSLHGNEIVLDVLQDYEAIVIEPNDKNQGRASEEGSEP